MVWYGNFCAFNNIYIEMWLALCGNVGETGANSVFIVRSLKYD